MDTSTSNQEINLGIYAGDVPRDEVDGAIATAEKSILFGEQARLPHFPEDQRLLKLHSGHPLVLLFWEVLKKVPEHVRPDPDLSGRDAGLLQAPSVADRTPGAPASALGVIGLLAALVLGSCGGFSVHRGSAGPGVAGEVNALLAQMTSVLQAEAGEIAVLGFREADGKQTPRTEALDEYLLSSLVVAETPIAVGVGATEIREKPGSGVGEWEAGALLPEAWQKLESPRLLSGQVHYEPPWAYVRLLLTDRVSGEVIGSVSGRVRERTLERAGTALSARRSGIEPGKETAGVEEVAVDLHVLVRRTKGGFAELVELKEGGTLQKEDRLQLRFRVHSDCSVYAFLFQLGGDGQRQSLFATEAVYKGITYYGPSEYGWITLSEENEVYTLYFIAGSRLEEDNEELFEHLADLIQQGAVDRFSGLDQVDAILAEYLSRHMEGEERAVKIVRDPEGIEKGKVETFMYQDGTRLESAPELLSDIGMLVRAFSFEVQIQ